MGAVVWIRHLSLFLMKSARSSAIAPSSVGRAPTLRVLHLVAVMMLVVWRSALAIDEPRYVVVRTDDVFEVRRYEPYIVARTVVSASALDAGSQGFRILAGYIFGRNNGARRIEMTAPVSQAPTKIAMMAPVAQSASSAGYVLEFLMPREWTLDTIPKPLDPRVKLAAVPSRTVAVIRYSGIWSQSRFQEQLDKLKKAIGGSGLIWHGEPTWARYDPPWKPWFLRRNEIWLELD